MIRLSRFAITSVLHVQCDSPPFLAAEFIIGRGFGEIVRLTNQRCHVVCALMVRTACAGWEGLRIPIHWECD